MENDTLRNRLRTITLGALYAATKDFVNAVEHAIFRNGHGLTPQEACDVLGTNAGELFACATDARLFLDAMLPGNKLAPPHQTARNWTINADGTVTIADPSAKTEAVVDVSAATDPPNPATVVDVSTPTGANPPQTGQDAAAVASQASVVADPAKPADAQDAPGSPPAAQPITGAV